MSCDCGCCPKCGCHATCTCNRTFFSKSTLESREDFSYVESPVKTAADNYEEHYNLNGDMEYASRQDEFSGAQAKGSGGITNFEADYGHTW